MSTHSPQSSPPPCAPSHAYPSPRSKSPPLTHRPVRSLLTLRFPLSDLTRFSLAQAASELASTETTPPPLRSPIPLFTQPPHAAAFSFRSPIFEPPPTEPSPALTFETPSRSPRRAVEHSRKWNRRRASSALCSPPPSPCKYAKCSSPPLPMRPAPVPPPSTTFPTPPPPPLLAISRQKRTKRELAELQWQVLLHRSLAWSVRTRREGAGANSEYLGRDEGGPLSGLNLERGGLRIMFTTVESQANAGHWTDALDRDLVRRLWERLLVQGCRPVAQAIRVKPRLVIPSIQCVPFPALAPPIELDSPVKCDAPWRARVSALTSPPPAKDFPTSLTTPELKLPVCSDEVPIPVRERERELSHVEFPMPPSLLPTKSKLSLAVTKPPKGVLTPPQLVAQLALRRSLGRARPIRRGAGGTSPQSVPAHSGLRVA